MANPCQIVSVQRGSVEDDDSGAQRSVLHVTLSIEESHVAPSDAVRAAKDADLLVSLRSELRRVGARVSG